MSTVVAHARPRRHATRPRWPSLALGLLAALAALSLAQGIVDLVLPALTGEEPFGLLFEMSGRHGVPFLAGYVFLHNLGLAALVPGFGFVAAWFEKKTANRAHIGLLLAGSVGLSLLVGLQYILTARERFDLLLTLPLFLAEAGAVMLVAVVAARELRGFVPTPAYEWSLVKPLRAILPPFTASAAVLAALALVEAAIVLGAV